MRTLFALACLFGLTAGVQAQYQSSFSFSASNGGFGGNGAVSVQNVTDGFGNVFRVTTFANGQTIQQPLNGNLTNGVPFVDPFASARFGGFGGGYGSGLGFGVGVNHFGNGFGATGLNHVGVGFGGFNHGNHLQAIPFGNTFLVVPRHH